MNYMYKYNQYKAYQKKKKSDKEIIQNSNLNGGDFSLMFNKTE